MTNKSNRELYSAWWALRLTFGLVPFLAGLDKFFNILTDWAQYQSPLLQQFFAGKKAKPEPDNIPTFELPEPSKKKAYANEYA